MDNLHRGIERVLAARVDIPSIAMAGLCDVNRQSAHYDFSDQIIEASYFSSVSKLSKGFALAYRLSAAWY